MDTLDYARFFADYLGKCGGYNIDILEAGHSKMFEYMLVCSAEDKYMAQGLLVALLDYAKQNFNQVNSGIEGYKKADWIVVDFDKLVVHIFQDKTRQRYCMEKLWR